MNVERAGGKCEVVYTLETHTNHLELHIGDYPVTGPYAAYQGLIDTMFMRLQTGCDEILVEQWVARFVGLDSGNQSVRALGDFVLGIKGYHDLDSIAKVLIDHTINCPRQYSSAFSEYLKKRKNRS